MVLIGPSSQNFFTIVKALTAQAAADENYRSVYKVAERELTDAYVSFSTSVHSHA
jgi:hypothetical protein